MYSPKVCKYKCITFPFEFHNFLQFLLDIKSVSNSWFWLWYTLAKTNSPQMQRKKKLLYLLHYSKKFFFECFTEPISWSQLSTRSLRQMLCGSHIEIWNLANHKKQNKNIKMLDLLMKTKKQRVWCSLFYLSCDLQDCSF